MDNQVKSPILHWTGPHFNDRMEWHRTVCRRYQVVRMFSDSTWVAFVDCGLWKSLGLQFDTVEDAKHACECHFRQGMLVWQPVTWTTEYRVWRSICSKYQVVKANTDEAPWIAMMDDGDWINIGEYTNLVNAMHTCEIYSALQKRKAEKEQKDKLSVAM